MSYFFDYTGKLDSEGFFKNESDVWNWCENVLGYYESDLSYDYSDFHQAMALSVQDSVYLSRKLGNLSQLPVRFDKVEGNLWLAKNQLTSLVGLPKTCKTISIDNNPLSFEVLMPLSKIQEIKRIHLPIAFENKFKDKGFEFKIEYDNYICIEGKSLSDFQAMLTKIEQTELVKQQQRLLVENKAVFLAFNQAFQQKTLFKGKHHEL